MNELALFAGAGGGLLGGRLLGWRTICYVERDFYCQKVIQARIKDGFLDDAPIWDDVKTFDGKPWVGLVDVVSAGFPCQPFSVAGKQKGENDERNMWPDTIRIIGEIRPRFAFLENVPGLLAHEYVRRIFGDLAALGYDAKWGVLGAHHAGAPHKRDRLWIRAYATCGGLETKHLPIRQRRSYKTKTYTGGMGKNVANTNHDSIPHDQQHNITDFNLDRNVWWSIEPNVGRVANGVASRVDRLKTIGNGQVPIVASTAWRMLT